MISKETASEILWLYGPALKEFQDKHKDDKDDREYVVKGLNYFKLAIEAIANQDYFKPTPPYPCSISSDPKKALQQLLHDYELILLGVDDQPKMESFYNRIKRKEMTITTFDRFTTKTNLCEQNSIKIGFPSREWLAAFFKELYGEKGKSCVSLFHPNRTPFLKFRDNELTITAIQEDNQLLIHFPSAQISQAFKRLLRHAPRSISIIEDGDILRLSAKKVEHIYYEFLAPTEVCFYKSAAIMDALYVTRMLGQVLRGMKYYELPHDVIVEIISCSINNMFLDKEAIGNIVKDNLNLFPQQFGKQPVDELNLELAPTGLPSSKEAEEDYLIISADYSAIRKDEKYVYFYFLDIVDVKEFRAEFKKLHYFKLDRDDRYSILKIPITRNIGLFSTPYYEQVRKDNSKLCLPYLKEIDLKETKLADKGLAPVNNESHGNCLVM